MENLRVKRSWQVTVHRVTKSWTRLKQLSMHTYIYIYMWSEVKRKLLSHVSLSPRGLYTPWNSPAKNIGVDSLSLIQEIFPTQGLNPGLPHCWQILYQLSHKGNPRILGWVAYPFSSGSSWPRNQTRVFRIAGGFFTNWAIRETLTCVFIR